MENKQKKFIPTFFSFFFLISITLSFISIFHFYRPNFELIPQSYDDKMKTLRPYYQIMIFINKTAEKNSTVLFLNWSIFVLAQPILYPYIKSDFYGYKNNQDQKLLNYLRNNLIHYVFIDNLLFSLSSNTTLFLKFEYKLNPKIYLLKINRTTL